MPATCVSMGFIQIFSIIMTCSAQPSCCLRSEPIESLSDGINLQNILLSNHKQHNRVSLSSVS